MQPKLLIKASMVILLTCVLVLSFSAPSYAQTPAPDCPEVEPPADATAEPTQESIEQATAEELPLIFVAEVSSEEMHFLTRFNYREGNLWIYGTWEFTHATDPLRIGDWYGPVAENMTFSIERRIRVSLEEWDTWDTAVFSGEFISESEVAGTFTYKGNTVEWVATLEEPPESTTPAAIDPATPGTVTGRVFRADTASLVSGAVVSLKIYCVATEEIIIVGKATTDEQGRFSFTDIKPGGYLVTITLDVTNIPTPCSTHGFEIRSGGIRFTSILDNGDRILTRGDYPAVIVSPGSLVERDFNLAC